MGDYGYFLNWQQDEAPAVLVKEKLEIYYEAVNKKWHKHAPTHMKTAARNMYYNQYLECLKELLSRRRKTLGVGIRRKEDDTNLETNLMMICSRLQERKKE